MSHPHQGGSYRREKDESLTRLAFTDTAKPEATTEANEPAAPSAVETAPEETTGAKKGKS